MLSLVALLTLLPLPFAWAGSYSLQDDFSGKNFLSGFNVLDIEDPTHGRTNYVNAETASLQNLTFASDNAFVLRADAKTVLDPQGPGRNSVRISSKKTYEDGVWVFNIRHMPTGCGTWPAVWSFGGVWPTQGEIDILEGVNDLGPNSATLHTMPGCTMPTGLRGQSGTQAFDDCNSLTPENRGCGVRLSQETSYGPAFNSNGGGWYAMEKTQEFIKVWFWPRNDPAVPFDVKNGMKKVDTGRWGLPGAFFPTTPTCSIKEKFGPQNIVINLALCGDWAGADDYKRAGCPATCVQHVNENPAAFGEAFFDFAWAKTYQ